MADETSSEESESEISPEEQCLVLEFQDITGIDNFEDCKQLLSRHRWDLQIAVQDTLNEAEGRTNVYHQEEEEEEEEIEQSDSDEELNHDRLQGPIATQATMGWSSWLFSVVAFPLQFTVTVISDVLRFIVGLVWPSLVADTTPLEDILCFKNNFEAKYGRTHPTFYEGSYSQAIDDAKKELRFVLVYLHSSEHRHTHQFCRCLVDVRQAQLRYSVMEIDSTLANDGFKEYVNGNMLFWAADVQSQEGYRVSYALRETTYPFLAVICLKDNRMMVVGRLQGVLNVDACLAKLSQILHENEPSLIAARSERQERSFNQTLRAEQDAAYLESLRADQEKERQKCLEAETKRLQEEKVKEKEQSLQNKMEAIAKKREELLGSLPPQPQANHTDAIRIVIRLPHGERMDRCFLKTHRLQSLYDYVFCNEQCPPDFKLVSHFPRKEFELDPDCDVTLEDVGLLTSAMLFVEDLTEDDGSEED